LWRTVSCGRDPTLEQGQSVRSPPPEEEGAAETCDKPTTTPIPCPPCREEVEKIRSKVKPGKWEGWGECVLSFRFCFSLLYCDLIGNKLN